MGFMQWDIYYFLFPSIVFRIANPRLTGFPLFGHGKSPPAFTGGLPPFPHFRAWRSCVTAVHFFCFAAVYFLFPAAFFLRLRMISSATIAAAARPRRATYLPIGESSPVLVAFFAPPTPPPL